MDTFYIPTMTSNNVLPPAGNDEGIIQSPAHCGRESRHTCRLPHSEPFPNWSSTQRDIISEGLGFCFIHFASLILFLFSNFTFLCHFFKQQLANLNI